jgi:hypothetical protein
MPMTIFMLESRHSGAAGILRRRRGPYGVQSGKSPLSSGSTALKVRNIVVGALAALMVAGTAVWFSLDKETRGLLATFPTNRDLLFWSVPQRDAAFRALDRLAVLAKWRNVPAGGTPLSLPRGRR